MDIDFRKLRHIYLQEKKSPQRLARVRPDFYKLLREYVRKERDNLAHSPGVEDVQALMQFANLVKLVGDTISIRQRKIVQMAISASFSEFYEPENLVGWEQDMYNEILNTVRKYREIALSSVGLGSGASSSTEERSVSPPSVEESVGQPAQPAESSSEPPTKEVPTPTTVRLRILKSIPAFIGTDYNTYGPYEEGAVVDLPPGVAEILLVRNLAEVVKDEDTNAQV